MFAKTGHVVFSKRRVKENTFRGGNPVHIGFASLLKRGLFVPKEKKNAHYNMK